MAEGGGEDRDENPFSFKKFVKNKGQSNDGEDSDSDGSQERMSLDLPDISAGQGRERRKNTEETFSRKGRREEDNPFSFKKFLQSGTHGRTNPGGPSGISTLDLANDLPDFVQDHFPSTSGQESSRRCRNHNIPDAPLPDFALDSASGNIGPHLPDRSAQFSPPEILSDESSDLLSLDNSNLSSGARPRINNVNLLNNIEAQVSVSDDLDSDSDGSDVIPQPNSASGQLPDFLSDSAIRPVSCGAAARAAAPRPAENGMNGIDLNSHSPDFLAGHPGEDAELHTLREENKLLMEQLNEARQFSERESQRVARMLHDMEAIQKKEAEDNAALEKMVQQVEANLAVTTKRAIAAESKVTKLQEEVKVLKHINQSLTNEKDQVRGGQCSPDPVKEKAKYASEQIAQAAKTAEQQLRQMLSGVKQLRMVSDVLASIEKISEVEPEPDTGASGSTDSTSSSTSKPPSS